MRELKCFGITIIMLFSGLLLTGCWSGYNSHINPMDKTFVSKLEAKIYAHAMSEKGYDAQIYENNWFNNGGYFWNVHVENKKKVEK